MVTAKVGRIALMSIRPEYASQIMQGTKQVEFRKRRLAPDVTHVLVYSTLPEGQLVGMFEVKHQHIASPSRLWQKFSKVAGIGRPAYFEYFESREQGVAIEIGELHRFEVPRPLATLGTVRPPQSFNYLSSDQATALRGAFAY